MDQNDSVSTSPASHAIGGAAHAFFLALIELGSWGALGGQLWHFPLQGDPREAPDATPLFSLKHIEPGAPPPSGPTLLSKADSIAQRVGRSIRPNLTELGLTLVDAAPLPADVAPHLAEVSGQRRSILGQLWSIPGTPFGRNRTKTRATSSANIGPSAGGPYSLARNRPRSGRARQNSANFGPEWAKFGPASSGAESDRTQPRVRQSCPGTGRSRAKVGVDAVPTRIAEVWRWARPRLLARSS